MNTLRNLNWGLIGGVLFSLGVWTLVFWALYHGIHVVR